MALSYEQAITPVFTGWSFAVSLALDVPSRLDGITRPAGHVWACGPGLNPDEPTRAIDVSGVGATILDMLDSAQRAAVGMPLRVRMPTAVPAEDGLIVADLGFSKGLAEAARVRALYGFRGVPGG